MTAIPSSQPFSCPQIQQFGYHGVEGATSNPLEVDSTATLLIRHLPEAVTPETLLQHFSHYGASSVRHYSSGKLNNCAFVDFKNEALASQAYHQLNGLLFLGKVLLVEKASKPGEHHQPHQTEVQSVSWPKNVSLIRDANQGSRSGSIPASEPIASRLGVDYPFPPHLKYAYPPPDGNILTNIVNALIAVPCFYTQVLHLMNKMNIPAPFRMALPTPPLTPPVHAPQPPPPQSLASKPAKPCWKDVSCSDSGMESSESEMESSGEEVNVKGVPKSARKRARREVIVGPAVDKSATHETVGVKVATLTPKEIPLIRKKNPLLQIKIAPKHIRNEQKDDDTGGDQKQISGQPNQDLVTKQFATADELEKGKLSLEEILSHPMFENYEAGNPNSVLYIKNLAKDVVEEDFYFIFGSLFGSIDTAKSGLHAILFQEGRMKDQAFVTFPSVELAHRALNLVNGYMFKGKPMNIQFSRNPAPQKQIKSMRRKVQTPCIDD